MTDVVESTSLLARIGDAAWRELIGRHINRVRALLGEFRGTEVDIAGDGLLATFDGPARALSCAIEIRRVAADDGLQVRAAVHVGEVEIVGTRIRGLAVHEVSRVLGAAQAGAIVVSQITRDLTVAAGMTFKDRGLHALKGIPGERRLYTLATLPGE